MQLPEGCKWCPDAGSYTRNGLVFKENKFGDYQSAPCIHWDGAKCALHTIQTCKSNEIPLLTEEDGR